MCFSRHSRQAASDRACPGNKENARDERTYKVEEERKKSMVNRWVTVILQKEMARLFANKGCQYTLILPQSYNKKMGKLVKAKRPLKAWGASDNLDVKGMLRTTVSTTKAATCRSLVNMVAVHWPKLLLADNDAKERAIIIFSPEGRAPIK